jgi:hypothetical protein
MNGDEYEHGNDLSGRGTGVCAEGLGSAGYSHAEESALGARNSVGVGVGHADRISALSTGTNFNGGIEGSAGGVLFVNGGGCRGVVLTLRTV